MLSCAEVGGGASPPPACWCWSVGRHSAPVLNGLVERLSHARGLVRAVPVIHAVLAGQACKGNPERAQLGGGEFERENTRIAGHLIGLRRIEAAVNSRQAETVTPPLQDRSRYPRLSEPAARRARAP